MRLIFATAWLLLWCAAAAAQVPPAPAEGRFLDPDRAARVHFGELDSEHGRARLERHLQRRPDDSRGWTARAFWHAVTHGDAAAALADLERARGVIEGHPLRERETLWSEGWIRLHLGHVPEARDAWTRAMQMHGGRPFWVPHSFAVLAELGGERHVALGWYAVAVRDMPQRWGSREQALAYTRRWRDAERNAMLALHDAWRAERDHDPAH